MVEIHSEKIESNHSVASHGDKKVTIYDSCINNKEVHLINNA